MGKAQDGGVVVKVGGGKAGFVGKDDLGECGNAVTCIGGRNGRGECGGLVVAEHRTIAGTGPGSQGGEESGSGSGDASGKAGLMIVIVKIAWQKAASE